MNDGSNEPTSWRALIGHREFVRADDSLETVQQRFAAGTHDFLAVLDGRTLLGVCARRDVGTLLGARFGFALHARARVAGHLTPHAICVRADAPVPEVLREIAGRRDEHFYDDVLLVDPHGEFLGLIPVRELVRLQNNLLEANIDELELRQRQIEEDLRMAREVQVALLPREFPECRSENGRALRFAQVFQPAGGVSGDFFDVIAVDGQAAGLLMCDVMGHGVRSALVTAMVRTLVEEIRGDAHDPGRFLTRLNANLTRLLRRTGDLIFVTASYAVVDAGARRLTFAHAGHPFPLRWSRRAGTAALLSVAADVGGPALGLEEEFCYANAVVPLEGGDRVVLVTDGLLEAADAHGEEFGAEALCRAIERAADGSLADVLQGALRTAATHAGAVGFADDVCLLGCELAG